MNIQAFQNNNFINGLKSFFKDLKVPINYIDDQATTAQEILKDTYKENDVFQLINEVYFVGMVDDAAFEGNKSLDKNKIKSDYDGVLIFGVTLKQRENNLLPTRSQLAEISRAFNREFYYTPAIVVFKYSDTEKVYLAFANTERLKYKQEWREGEKAGKVTLLRDININNTHRGHLDILNKLQLPDSGNKKIDSFDKLYKYWQEVFSVSVLNKKFYQDLSTWYFHAVNQVKFPNEPTFASLQTLDQKKLDEAINEHQAKNVIRLLTRLLFTWFIKEKGLIPEELFDLKSLQEKYLNNISPLHEENTLFDSANKESIYYKAILQNLFFATLNCPINGDSEDKRIRAFRSKKNNNDFGVTHLMRYEDYFKDSVLFLNMVNKSVPFLNGGLFECLDIRGEKEKKEDRKYIDGFSDNLPKGEQLIVPDYLFFGADEKVDLSVEYGSKNKQFTEANFKGLIPLLNSYKFTITENTPIEEDVALDPELLGKVFENLLASYNPETKTTARKQTGSFYTPREIVNYMVDESLIAYLKNQIKTNKTEEQWDTDLHILFSFDNTIPKIDTVSKADIIKALDKCTILDPACGSGAFPMGILQKMVHVLQKLDPTNELWQEYQLEKAQDESAEVFKLRTKEEREERLKEINNAFDVSINHPDYARKLFLIENCIYGVDIQPIATQISKLRFFISLVVDQKNSTDNTNNFNVRPLPNLETKFVTANTLIGIEKENNLFSTKEIKDLEQQLKTVRHKLFNAKTPRTKRKYREADEILRIQIANKLTESGFPLDEAEKLATWNPYDQNASSPFFDPEWMFDIKDGFDVVIGNPPYLIISKEEFLNKYKNYQLQEGKPDLYRLFIERTSSIINKQGIFSFITPNTFLTIPNSKKLRKMFLENYNIQKLINFDSSVFESASVNSLVFVIAYSKSINEKNTKVLIINEEDNIENVNYQLVNTENWLKNEKYEFNIFIDQKALKILDLIESGSKAIDSFEFKVSLGAQQYHNTIYSQIEIKERFLHSSKMLNNNYILELGGKNIFPFNIKKSKKENFVDFSKEFYTKPNSRFFKGSRIVFREITGKTIVSSYTEQDFVINKSCYSVIGKKNNLKRLQLTISSLLIGYWVQNSGDKSNQRLFPRITKRTIMKLPIKLYNSHLSISLHDIISFSIEFDLLQFFNKIKDAVIFNIYFSLHMKEKEIDVLEFIEQDIEKVMKDREFNSLNDTEKEEVINQLHAIWSHPDNEVRNRIALFAVRSPEILKPILES